MKDTGESYYLVLWYIVNARPLFISFFSKSFVIFHFKLNTSITLTFPIRPSTEP